MNQEDKILKIFNEHKKINSFFIKANNKIIEEESSFLNNQLLNEQRNEFLKQRWKEKFKANLFLDHDLTQNYILFDTNQDKTLFLLKFQS
jgi:hypothetical protein